MMIGCMGKLCGEECESVVHVNVLWECPVYDTIRNTFMKDLDNLLGGNFEEFSALNNFERTGFCFRVRINSHPKTKTRPLKINGGCRNCFSLKDTWSTNSYSLPYNL